MPEQPLDPDERRAWVALSRLMTVLPRALEDDLQRSAGLPMTSYIVLMHLSEAPAGHLTMTELAARAALSPSRMTRVVDALQRDGHVVRTRGSVDGRATLAAITAAGSKRLDQAWPSHLAGVRTLVVDQLDAAERLLLASVAERLVARIEDRGGGAEGPVGRAG